MLTLAPAHPKRAATGALRPLTNMSSMTAGVGVVVLAFVAYLATMAPDLYSLDSPELTTAAHKLGIAHAPGYPLYTLTGWLFSHTFPIGTVAFRLNLLSGIFGAVAVAAVYALSLRMTSRTLVAAAAALALAFSYYFWVDALAAEIYTLDAALFAGVLLAAFAWRDAPSASRAAIVGLMLGLACATRTTSVLVLPALLAFAVMSGERSWRAYAAAGAGLAAGLAFYLYLPMRSATGTDIGPGDYDLAGALTVWDLASVDGFWRHITAAPFRDDVFAYGPASAIGEAGTFASRLTGAFLVIGIPLGIAGIVRHWQRDRAGLVLVAGAVLPLTVFFINYGAVDKEFMFLPAFVAWALWVAAGIDWAIDASAADAAWITGGAVALVLPVALFAVNFSQVTLHDERSVRADSEAFLAQVPQGAIVYGPFLDIAPYQYLQEVEGMRPDVRFVNGWTVDDRYLLDLAAANAGTTPLLLTRDQPVLRRLYDLVPVGEGFEVRTRAP